MRRNRISRVGKDIMGNNNSNGIRFQLSQSTEMYGGVQECRIYTDYPEKGGQLKRIVSGAEQTDLREQEFNNTFTPREESNISGLK